MSVEGMITSATTTKVSETMSDRCGSWRMVPAMALVAVCIIGIVTALFWNQPYLTIPPAVGLFASFYQLYIAGNYGRLKSLGESAEGIAGERQRLNVEVTTIKGENGTLKLNVATLTKTKDQLTSEVNNLNTAIENTQSRPRPMSNAPGRMAPMITQRVLIQADVLMPRKFSSVIPQKPIKTQEMM